MPSTSTPARFIQRTRASGFLVNIDNTAEVLELLDEYDESERQSQS